MFTGIVLDIGTVKAIDPQGDDLRVCFSTDKIAAATLSPGDSVAVNGVCLTVTTLFDDGFCADISKETIACTTLGRLESGSRVNLETALTPSTVLGGHIVSGHVDSVGRIVESVADGRSVRYKVELPADLMKYVAVKGSVTVDGVSLTVNSVDNNGFGVNIVPHTQDMTIFSGYETGTAVNVEVDLIARYLERLMAAGSGK